MVIQDSETGGNGVGLLALGNYPDVADYNFAPEQGTIVVSTGVTGTRLV